MWQRFKLIYKQISTYEYSPRYSRLAGDLACYEPQFQKRVIDTGSQNEQWAIKGQALLDIAKANLKEYKIDEGWKSYHSAICYELFGYNNNERLAFAKSLLKETDKLNEWRKEAVRSLLGHKKDGDIEVPAAEVLAIANELKDEDYNNQYYMNRLSHNLFWLLSGLMFIVLILIAIYFFYNPEISMNETGSEIKLSVSILGVLLFGVLGAITSAIVSTRNLTKSSRIKEISSSEVIVLSKIFVGAGFSVFIFLLLHSSFAESIQIFNFHFGSPLDYFAIAFASGFTERLAQKSLDAIIGKEPPSKAKV